MGDAHQRIYRRKVVLGRAGVNVRGRSRRLRINYRTTDEIRRHAVALLHGVEVDDLDGGKDTTRGYKSLLHGAPPEVKLLGGFDEEITAIQAWAENGASWSPVSDDRRWDFHNLSRAGFIRFVETAPAVRDRVLGR